MLAAALEYYGERGMLDDTPVPITLERDRRSGAAAGLSPLRYPGKLTADLAGGRLFISDSNNHRRVRASSACSCEETISVCGPLPALLGLNCSYRRCLNGFSVIPPVPCPIAGFTRLTSLLPVSVSQVLVTLCSVGSATHE